jgi:hypothetical protein
MATIEIRSPTAENRATETKRSRSDRLSEASSDETDGGAEMDRGKRTTFDMSALQFNRYEKYPTQQFGQKRSDEPGKEFQPNRMSVEMRRRFNRERPLRKNTSTADTSGSPLEGTAGRLE